MRHRFASLVAVALVVGLATAPVRADQHGGIEIGARGVKAVVLDVTDGDLKVIWSDTANTAITAGLAERGTFDPKAVAASVQAVKKFAEKMKDQSIRPENIHVAGSSGLFSALKGNE